MRRKGLYFAAVVLTLAATAAGTGFVAREDGTPADVKTFGLARPRQEPRAAAARPPYPFRVLPSRLTPRLRIPFEALGDRLYRPGKERLTLSGMLTLAGGAARPAQAFYEFPHLLQVVGHTSSVVSFDEREAMRVSRAVRPEDEALVETLFYDSVEHFFFAQVRGAATRFLGARATPEDAGASYRGPFYDVYEVTEEVAAGGGWRPQTKRYFFNSDTQLLEVVRYEVERDGARVPVEVRVGGWRRVQGQQVPTSFERLEGGRQVFTFTAASAALGPRPRGAQGTQAGNPA